MKEIKSLIAVLIILVAGCKKPVLYSDIPEISFKSLTTQKDAGGFDTEGHVVISFTDGDGDIGYRPSGNGSPFDDTASVYFRNFIVKQSHKENGIWKADAVELSGRIPWLTPDGSNKALKGEIAMDLFLPPNKIKDTIHYDIFIYDRALHQSNAVTTADIVINTQ